MNDDPYSRLDYRRMVAWPRRQRREGPLLAEVLEQVPSRRLLDLGCGTGEHARLLADRGFEVVGIDRSESMIAKARQAGEPEGVRFVVGDLRNLGDLAVLGPFGGAICLGNTLPHLTGAEDLDRWASGLARLLLPASPLLLQILNYDRIFDRNERYLPLNFRPVPAASGDEAPAEAEEGTGTGELVFLRLMTPRSDGTVVFNPSTLRYRPIGEPVLEIDHARSVILRGWRRGEIEKALAAVGLETEQVWGSVEKGAFEPLDSRDLVLLGRRRG